MVKLYRKGSMHGIIKNTTPFTTANPDVEFDPYRCALSERLKIEIEEVIRQVRGYESYYKTRKRTRRPRDEKIFQETIAALICDVIYRYLINPEQKIYLRLSHRYLGIRSRYRPVTLGKTVPSILEILSAPEIGFIHKETGSIREQWPGQDKVAARATTIWPHVKLIRRIHASGITCKDFGRRADEEIIQLKQTKQSRIEKGRLIEYQDTDTTHRIRSEVSLINHWLSCADISCALVDKHIDSQDRHMRRIFNNNSFEQGGRLFGGFWQKMNKQYRSSILIDNNPLVELDYGQMFLRLCYGMLRRQPPLGDLYDIPSLVERGASRQGIKNVINASLFNSKPLVRLPAGTRQHFPKGLHYKDIIGDILEYHKSVAHLLFDNMGMHLMFVESQILINTLLTLIDKGITALPIHDAVLVAHKDQEITHQVMLDSFKSLGGTEGKVSIKRLF